MGSLGILIGSVAYAATRFVPPNSETESITDDLSTAVPVKVAYYILPTSTATPTFTLTPTRKPTATRTATPTRKPTAMAMPTVPPTVTAPAPRPMTNAITATVTATSIAQATATPQPTASATVSTGEAYALLPVLASPDRLTARPADLNLALRGFAPVSATLALVDYTGETDGGAPQLAGFFADNRPPLFHAAFQVYDWEWSCDCRGPLYDDPEVTLVTLKATPGERLLVPAAGREIGNGFQVLVLYADAERIALKYTRSDGVRDGYTLHMESIAVDSNLQALYRQADAAGRSQLPALHAGQAFGTAKGDIRVAIRDAGSFMDPRSRKDWWRGH